MNFLDIFCIIKADYVACTVSTKPRIKQSVSHSQFNKVRYYAAY